MSSKFDREKFRFRFPLLSGNFGFELADMAQAVTFKSKSVDPMGPNGQWWIKASKRNRPRITLLQLEGCSSKFAAILRGHEVGARFQMGN